MQNFSKKIKKARLKLGLSKEEMAAKLGVSYVTLYRWERGSHEPLSLAKSAVISKLKELQIND